MLKAGAAYLPLDPDLPTERLRYMLEDARPRAVLTTEGLTAALPTGAVPLVPLDAPEVAAELAEAPGHDPTPPLHVHHAAYVIYTSGSTGRPKGVLLTPGHGREEQLAPDVDLSRTVGWFTSIFPVRLDPGPVDEADAMAGGPAIGTALKRVKEQLRALPDHGVGYGLRRHLHPEIGPRLAARPAPQISFNYLGRFAVDGSGGPWTAVPGAGVLAGGFDTAMPVAPYLLEINAFTEDTARGPRLGVTWAFPTTLLDESDVHELARRWFAGLDALTMHVERGAGGGHTPSDLPLLSLTQEEIDEFEADTA